MIETPPSSAGAIVVVGAGAAGLMAALAAARAGAAVTVCEHLDRPGLKLLATGGGRCNVTNTLPAETFMERFGRHGRFMAPALAALGNSALRGLLSTLGVETAAEDGVHVFPTTQSAASVRDALWRECRRLGVRFLMSTEVTDLAVDGGCVSGVRSAAGQLPAARVVLATGGKAYPRLGATGLGYDLARRAGHSVVAPLPALAPLVAAEFVFHNCAGVSLRDVRLRIALPGHRREGTLGDLLFTHTGLSGPAALDLSGEVAATLTETAHVPLEIDFRQGSADAWLERFAAGARRHGKRQTKTELAERMPVSVAEALCGAAGVPPDLCLAELDKPGRQALAERLTGARVLVTGTGGFDEAMITRGGVTLKEVNPNALESRRTRGLHFAGEILNLDGPCGGFNLQWAFSSGFLAGQAAAQALGYHSWRN